MIVVTFYDIENKYFYQAAISKQEGFGSEDEMANWTRRNIENGQVQEFLALRNAEESCSEDILAGCPCPELMERMYNEGFYNCNFENFDYEIRIF